MKKRWFTNGVVDKLCFECPEGFHLGRSKKINQTNYKHYTNGIDNIFSDTCPEGYYPGITSKINRKAVDNKGKKHYTNGQDNVFSTSCPEGYYEGITIKNKRKQNKTLLVDNVLKDLNVEEFIYYYQNHSNNDCSKFYNLNVRTIKQLAEKLNLSKDLKSVKDNILNKTKITNLEKYGYEHSSKSPTEQEKRKKVQEDKYGFNAVGRAIWTLNTNITDEFKELLFDSSKSKMFMQSNYKNFTKQDLCDRFNCNINSLNNWIYRFNLSDYVKQANSHYENEIAQIFYDLNPITHYRHPLMNGKEIDIYFPGSKIGIEFNGNYWHSSLNVPKNYHQEKSILAEKAGIRLIHIYEYEWLDKEIKEKILQLLSIAFNLNSTNIIYARKCKIKEISNKEAEFFNNKTHLQGHRNAQVTYGLFYKNELVQLMSFSKTKYNRNLLNDNEWEIIRGCPGSNNIVVGGVSKLFNHFIKEHNPNKIFSYCDFNKFNGRSYEILGMKYIGLTTPDMHWFLEDNNVVNRNPKKHNELKNKAVAQIFGAGSKKYLWSKENL